MLFNSLISPKKLFSFCRYLDFWPDFFGHVGERLDKKAKISFKTYDVTNKQWETNNGKTHIALISQEGETLSKIIHKR